MAPVNAPKNNSLVLPALLSSRASQRCTSAAGRTQSRPGRRCSSSSACRPEQQPCSGIGRVEVVSNSQECFIVISVSSMCLTKIIFDIMINADQIPFDGNPILIVCVSYIGLIWILVDNSVLI